MSKKNRLINRQLEG